MLKKFFISMLGTMAGLWISLALLVIIGTVSIGALIGKYSSQETGLEKPDTLKVEYAEPDDVAVLSDFTTMEEESFHALL